MKGGGFLWETKVPIQQEDQLKRSLRIAFCDEAVAIRQRRRLVEEKWLRSRRMWMGFPVGTFVKDDSEAKAYYIPAARRVLERTCIRGVKLVTPSVKWFEVQPMGDVTQQQLTNIDQFLWYVIRKRIKSRSIISQLFRSLMLYSMCILKTSVQVSNGMLWPMQRAVDPFAFYMFPETASTLDEAEVIFEDFLWSYEKYQTFVDRGLVDPIEKSALQKPDWPYHLTERLAYQGITDPTSDVDQAIDKVAGQLEKSTNAFVSCTEMWRYWEGSLYQIYIVWNLARGPRIVGFVKSKYEQPLYRATIHRPLPGETYTNSQAEDISELDIIHSDLMNKFLYAVDWEQGFVAFSEQAPGRKEQYRMRGRAKWEMSDDPRASLNFVAPPNTSTNLLRAAQIAQAYIQSMGGSGTISEGQPGRNMPRAGFAVNNLINLGMADIQDIAEIIEQEVLTPGLSDIYKVAHFIPDDQLMRIPGGIALYQGVQGGLQQSSVLRKSDIVAGDMEFEWVGSLQFQDENQRAQRLMIFANLVMQPQVQQQLAQQGVMLNLTELIPMIFRSGIGERGLAKVLVPMPQQQQQAVMQQGQEGQQGSASANGVPGLQYRLPTVTNGFVQQ